MIIQPSEIVKAITHINTLASIDKKPNGIAFNIKDDSIDIYYNFSDKEVLVNIPATIGEAEHKGIVVFDYKRLLDTVNSCKDTGNIKTKDVEFVLSTNPDGSGRAEVKVTKTLLQSNGEETFETTVAQNTYDLSWTAVDKLPVSQKNLSRHIYTDMFEDGGTTWGVEVFSRMVDGVTSGGGDAKIVYLSAKNNGAFVVNTGSMLFTPCEDKVDVTIPFNLVLLKSVVQVLKGTGADGFELKVVYNEERKPYACLFYLADRSLSIYTAIVGASQSHIASISRYVGTEYTSFNVNLLSEVVADSLKAVYSMNNAADCRVAIIKNDENNYDFRLSAENSGASVKNSYTIHCAGFTSREEPAANENGEVYKFSVNTKLLLDVISRNRNNYIGFDFHLGESGVDVLRVGCINYEAGQKAMQERLHTIKEQQNLIELPAPTVEDRLAIRKEYLETCCYLAVTSK